MNKLIFIFLLLSLFSCSKEEEQLLPKIQGRLPFIIIVGQSNAEGLSPVNTAPDWLKSNNYLMSNYLMWDKNRSAFNYYQLGKNTGSDKNNDNRFGFDIFFTYRYLNYNGGNILAIKQSLGNVPISEKGSPNKARWNPDITKIPIGERAMVSELTEKLTRAREYATANNVELIPIAVLYHQGEADANEEIRLADYKENLISLISYIRQLMGESNIPIINAEIMYRNDNYKKVNKMFYEIGKLDPNFKTVDMSQHQTSIGDNLHYDASAFEFMGNEMFNILKSF